MIKVRYFNRVAQKSMVATGFSSCKDAQMFAAKVGGEVYL